MTTAVSPNARPSASIVIACVALAVSGIAIGMLIGRISATSTPVVHAEESPTAPVDLGPVLGELREIKALLSQADGSGSSERPAENRAPAVSVDRYADRLDAEINRLKNELDRVEEQRGVATTAATRWKAPGYASLDVMFAFVVNGMKVPEGGIEDSAGHVQLVVGDEVVEELTRAHVLWARNDVFDRYGTPSHLSDSERGIDYFYSRHLDADRVIEIGFHVKDGVVTTVWAE